MDILLVCLAAIVIIFAAVCLRRYWCVIVAGKISKKPVLVKKSFSVKFYNSRLKAWCGDFCDEVHKFGYITNLTEDEIVAGDRVWVTVGEYDTKSGYWRVEAERLIPFPESLLCARVISHDRTGCHCIYPNSKGVALFAILYGCTSELKVGEFYPVKIKDKCYAELL